MKIFIFGAGASLGSQGKIPYSNPSLQAPLVDELFKPVYQNSAFQILSATEFAECQKAVEGIENKSVEKWLTQEWNSIDSISDAMVKNAQRALFGHILFYIWNLLRMVSYTYTEQNGYNVFMRKLRQEGKPFGVISFNYDTMLDRAIADVFRLNFFNIESYLDNNFVKPHGSVNWLLMKRDGDQQFPSNQISDIRLRINMAMRQFFDKPIPLAKLTVYEPSFDNLNNTSLQTMWSNFGIDYFYPLIFLPLTNKRYEHVTEFYEKIIAKGKELLTKATEIYLIGYNAKDDIIKELLLEVPATTPALLHIVKNSTAEQTMEEVLHLAPSLLIKGKSINDGFWEFAERY